MKYLIIILSTLPKSTTKTTNNSHGYKFSRISQYSLCYRCCRWRSCRWSCRWSCCYRHSHATFNISITSRLLRWDTLRCRSLMNLLRLDTRGMIYYFVSRVDSGWYLLTRSFVLMVAAGRGAGRHPRQLEWIWILIKRSKEERGGNQLEVPFKLCARQKRTLTDVFLVMPFEEAEALRFRLRKKHWLPPMHSLATNPKQGMLLGAKNTIISDHI